MRRAEDDRPGIATCLEGLATVAAGPGRPERAARLLGAAEALRRAIGSPMPLVERPASEAAARTARTALGEAGFAAALDSPAGGWTSTRTPWRWTSLRRTMCLPSRSERRIAPFVAARAAVAPPRGGALQSSRGGRV